MKICCFRFLTRWYLAKLSSFVSRVILYTRARFFWNIFLTNFLIDLCFLFLKIPVLIDLGIIILSVVCTIVPLSLVSRVLSSTLLRYYVRWEFLVIASGKNGYGEYVVTFLNYFREGVKVKMHWWIFLKRGWLGFFGRGDLPSILSPFW